MPPNCPRDAEAPVRCTRPRTLRQYSRGRAKIRALGILALLVTVALLVMSWGHGQVFRVQRLGVKWGWSGRPLHLRYWGVED